MAENLVSSPSISPNPIKISPQILTKLTTESTPGVSAIQWNKPGRIYLDCSRYPAADHVGSAIFTSPSYKKCHPIMILRIARKYIPVLDILVVLDFVTMELFNLNLLKIFNIPVRINSIF